MQGNKTTLQFTGKGGEYFGIWIVNLLLSIVTLGIYSAWAKVRRMKYFYSNTKIDGVGFDYHASPKAILKGRIIAFLVFILYTVLSKFSPVLGFVLLIALFIATPWLIVRGMIFNARNSSNRGLRFDFTGKIGQAAKVFIGYPLLVLVTLGFAIPFVAQRTNKFLFENHKFGLSYFQSNALVKDFYMVYLKLFGFLVVLGLVAAFAMKALVGSVVPHASLHQVPFVQPTQQAAFEAPARVHQGGFIKVAGETTQSDKDEELEEPKDPFAAMMKAGMAKLGLAMVLAIGMGSLLLYGVLISSLAAYTKSRISNLVWNNTKIEHVGFVSTMRMRDLVWLYLTNMLALIFSLGLATPWVQMRMARYKAEHLALTGETDWDQFVGEKKESTKALGGEMADMFDVDVSFG